MWSSPETTSAHSRGGDRAMKGPIPFVAALTMGALSIASEAAVPVGEPHCERPTLHCLGVYWIVRDDPGRTASVNLAYRKPGASAWRTGQSLFRVERGAQLRKGTKG